MPRGYAGLARELMGGTHKNERQVGLESAARIVLDGCSPRYPNDIANDID